MRLVTHDNLETWLERRTSGKQVLSTPLTLNEVDQPRSLVYIPPGGWERVEERNPKLRGMGNIETMYGGFELELDDLGSFDYRVCIRRAWTEEWKGELLAVVTIDDNPPHSLYFQSKADQTVYHTINSNTGEISTEVIDRPSEQETQKSQEEVLAEIEAVLLLDHPDIAWPPVQGDLYEQEDIGLFGPSRAQIEEDEDTMRMILDMISETDPDPSTVKDTGTDHQDSSTAIATSSGDCGEQSSTNQWFDIPSTAVPPQVDRREVMGHVQRLSPVPEVPGTYDSNATPRASTEQQVVNGPEPVVSSATTKSERSGIVSDTSETLVPTIRQRESNSDGAVLADKDDTLVVDKTGQLTSQNTSTKNEPNPDPTSSHHHLPSIGPARPLPVTAREQSDDLGHAPSSNNVAELLPAMPEFSTTTLQTPQVDVSQESDPTSTNSEEIELNRVLVAEAIKILNASSSIEIPAAEEGCNRDQLQLAPKPDKSALQPVSQAQELISHTMAPLRLLNRAEDRLGRIQIDIYRGTLTGSRLTRTDSFEPSTSGTDLMPMDFDPERSVPDSHWEASDATESPWCRFVYEFGPSEVWGQAYQLINDSDRELAHQTVQTRLAVEKRKMEQSARLERERQDRTRRLAEALHLARIEKAAQVAMQEENARIEASRKEIRRREAKNQKAREKRARERLAKGEPPKRALIVPAAPAVPVLAVGVPAPQALPKSTSKSKPHPKEMAERRKKSEILVPESPPPSTSRHVSRLPLSQVHANYQRQQDQARRGSFSRASPKDHDRYKARAVSYGRPISPNFYPIINDDGADISPKAGPSRLARSPERRAREVSRHRERTHRETRHRHEPDARSRSPTRHRTDSDFGLKTHRYPENRIKTETGGSRHDRPAERDRDTYRLHKTNPHTNPSTKDYLARRERSDGPRAYGLANPARLTGSKSKLEAVNVRAKTEDAEWLSETESRENEGLNSIEEQRQAFKRRDALRREQKRKIEEKEARRAAKRRDQHHHQVNTGRRQIEEPRRPIIVDKVRRARPERIDRPERPERLDRVEREDRRSVQCELERREWRAKRAGEAAHGRLNRTRQKERRTAREVIDLTHLDD